MKIENLVTLILALCCFASPACAQTAPPASGARSGQPLDLEMINPPKTKGWIRIDKSTQTLEFYLNGQLQFKSVCGTGVGWEWKNTTHNGRHKVISKGEKKQYSEKYGAYMYYPLQFTVDEEFLHGSENFITLLGKGMPQSHGCVRLPMETAKKLYENMEIGDTVDVFGKEAESVEALGIRGLFEDLPNGKIRMRIAGPNATAKDREFAREMCVKKQLFYKPLNEKDRSKIRVGYSCLPDECWVSLAVFERAILKPGEKLTLDNAARQQ